jgi:uncharacterized membrane protein
MRETRKLLLRYPKLTALFAFFSVAYIAVTLRSVPTQDALNKYHVTSTQLHQISLTIVLPYILIWTIGLIGYLRLRTYVRALGDSEDGRAWGQICNGVLLLVLWLPLNVLLAGVAEEFYRNHPESTANSIRGLNYFNTIIMLAAFYLVYVGSKKLVEVAKVKAHGLTQRQSALFIVFSVLYVFIALSDTSRQVSHGASNIATYYLPDWLTVITILIPRILTWFIGLAAVANIMLYRKKVKGTIYKEGLSHIAHGLYLVIGGIVALRTIQSLSSVIGDWSLGLLLLLIYVLLAVLGAGYVLVSRGTKRLLKIEEL